MKVILTAGAATRLDGVAPHGCKALTPVKGRPIIEHQLDVLGDARIVCRAFHAPLLKKYGEVVVNDDMRGPADALLSALFHYESGPVTVVYADSYFTDLPAGDGWVGVNPVQGGRSWDLVYEDGHCEYAPLPKGMTGNACVGLYRFPDVRTLTLKLTYLSVYQWVQELGMAPVVNNWPGLDYVPVPSWRDVGDVEALAEMEAA